jgi:hypothetical protein
VNLANERGFPDADEAAVAIATPMTKKLPAIGCASLEYEHGHEVSGAAQARLNARLESRTNIEDGDSHDASPLAQIGFSDPGDARIGSALDRAYLREVSNLPDNEPPCVHGRRATVIVTWGVSYLWLHRILVSGEWTPRRIRRSRFPPRP